jgi:hypothetical protein
MTASRVKSLLQFLEEQGRKEGLSQDDKDQIFRLQNLLVRSVHLVDSGANGRRFAVVKRGAEMPEGTMEVIENEDGTLTTADQVEKAGYKMDPNTKKQWLGAAKKAYDDLGAVIEKLDKAEVEMGADPPSDLTKMLSGIAASLQKMCGDKHAADPAAPEKAKDGEEEEDAEKAKKADDAPDAAISDVASVELDGTVISGPLAEVAKAGRKMKGERFRKFKELVMGLQKMVDDLEPKEKRDAQALIDGALGKVTKSHAETTAQVAKLAELLTKAIAAGQPIGAGQASGEPDKVAKSAKPKDDPNDASWIGQDLNNPDLFRETADEETSFF